MESPQCTQIMVRMDGLVTFALASGSPDALLESFSQKLRQKALGEGGSQNPDQ